MGALLLCSKCRALAAAGAWCSLARQVSDGWQPAAEWIEAPGQAVVEFQHVQAWMKEKVMPMVNLLLKKLNKQIPQQTSAPISQVMKQFRAESSNPGCSHAQIS